MLTQTEVEAGFGSLIAAGHTLDEILSWSWLRIFQSIKAISVYHATALNAIASPVVQALGGKLKGAASTTRKKLHREMQEAQGNQRPEPSGEDALVAAEEQKLHGLAALGIPISVTSTTGSKNVDQFGLLKALRGAPPSGSDGDG